jgi:transglutaminase-like putative cysteine protease
MSAEECLAEGRGACRDLAITFMEVCREVGLAARFVSGYQMADPQDEQYMHAWAEVYLPGGGWRGFDPTHAKAVDGSYVPVAASPVSSLATPIEGGFSPKDTHSRIEAKLEVRSACLLR